MEVASLSFATMVQALRALPKVAMTGRCSDADTCSGLVKRSSTVSAAMTVPKAEQDGGHRSQQLDKERLGTRGRR